MRRALIEEILVNLEQVTRDGGRVLLPEGLRVEVVCTAKDGVLVVGPLKEVRFSDAYLAAATENETLFVEYENVFALRSKGKAQARPARTGFSPG